MTDETLQAKIDALRSWLRMHGEYSITIDLWDLYGTYGLQIKHLQSIVKISLGDHLEKRLDEAIAFIEKVEA